MDENKKKIFLSWSGAFSHEIAKEFEKWLKEFNKNIEVFLSSKIEGGKDGINEIQNNLNQSDYGLLLLTHDNINSPWMLYEAGALGKLTNSNVIPILINRDKYKIEIPFQRNQYHELDKESMYKLIFELFGKIEHNNTDNGIRGMFDGCWDTFESNIKSIIDEHKNKHPSRQGVVPEHQSAIDLSIENSLLQEVVSQGFFDIGIDEVFKDKDIVIKDLPKSLDSFVKMNIPPEYRIVEENKFKDDIFDNESVTTIIINNTRISSFLCFTDGKRILLFNRSDNKKLQSVSNDKYDCHGSVQFENYSIESKIDNKEFFDAKVLDIKSIPGFCFEDNTDKFHIRETVIMFGYAIFINPEDLDKAALNSNKNKIFTIHSNVPSNNMLTSKAIFARDFLR